MREAVRAAKSKSVVDFGALVRLQMSFRGQTGSTSGRGYNDQLFELAFEHDHEHLDKREAPVAACR